MCVGELVTDDNDNDASSTQTAIQNVGNSQTPHQWCCHPSTFRLVLRGRLGWHQTKRERISKIIRKKQRKIAEKERKKEEESVLLCRSCVLDLLNDEANLPLTKPPAPSPEEKEKTQEKQRDLVTNLHSRPYICGQLWRRRCPNSGE